MEFNEVLRVMVREQGSDLFLKVGSPPSVRVGGKLKRFSMPGLSRADMESFARKVLGEKGWEKLQGTDELDVAYSVDGVGRFRINFYRQRSSLAMAVRWVRTDISSFEALHLPDVLKEVALYENGLVLISGPTGSGKSTTQAAIIDYINRNRSCFIVTIEDPIEFLHEDRKSIISQREVGIDTASFGIAMKYMVRQNPDIILVGEMRDPDTFEAALSACETGHLVMSTLHTLDVMHSLGRIMDFFPHARHDEIRALLSMNLRVLTCQRLIPRKDGKGLVPAMEVMITNPSIKKLIREDEMRKIPGVIHNDETGRMQTLNQALLKLVGDGLITEEEALMNSNEPAQLKMNLEGIHLDEERGII